MVLLDVLDVVVEVAPVVPRPELVVPFHVQELVRLLQVIVTPLRRAAGRGELGQGRRGPEQRPLLPAYPIGGRQDSLIEVDVLLRVEVGRARLPVLLLGRNCLWPPASGERHGVELEVLRVGHCGLRRWRRGR